MSESRPQAVTQGALLDADTRTLMQRDLSLLAAHLLLHILEIDRQHTRQAVLGVGTQTVKNAKSGHAT